MSLKAPMLNSPAETLTRAERRAVGSSPDFNLIKSLSNKRFTMTEDNAPPREALEVVVAALVKTYHEIYCS